MVQKQQEELKKRKWEADLAASQQQMTSSADNTQSGNNPFVIMDINHGDVTTTPPSSTYTNFSPSGGNLMFSTESVNSTSSPEVSSNSEGNILAYT